MMNSAGQDSEKCSGNTSLKQEFIYKNHVAAPLKIRDFRGFPFARTSQGKFVDGDLIVQFVGAI